MTTAPIRKIPAGILLTLVLTAVVGSGVVVSCDVRRAGRARADEASDVGAGVVRLCTQITGETPTGVSVLFGHAVGAVVATGRPTESCSWVLCDMPDGGQVRVLLYARRPDRVAAVLRSRPSSGTLPAAAQMGAVGKDEAARLSRGYLRLLSVPDPAAVPVAVRYVPDDSANRAHWMVRYRMPTAAARSAMEATESGMPGAPVGMVTLTVDARDGGLNYYGGLFGGAALAGGQPATRIAALTMRSAAGGYADEELPARS